MFTRELKAISFQVRPRVFIFLCSVLLLPLLFLRVTYLEMVFQLFISFLFSCTQLTASAFPLRRIHSIRVSSSLPPSCRASSSRSRTVFLSLIFLRFIFPASYPFVSFIYASGYPRAKRISVWQTWLIFSKERTFAKSRRIRCRHRRIKYRPRTFFSLWHVQSRENERSRIRKLTSNANPIW